MKKNWILALLVIAAMALTSCESKDSNSTEDQQTTEATVTEEGALTENVVDQLAGAWEVVALNGNAIEGVHPEITFDFSNMTIYGNFGCNDYNGSFQADNTLAINFGDLAGTRAICDAIETEMAFTAALEVAKFYQINEDGSLYLQNEAKDALVTLVRK